MEMTGDEIATTLIMERQTDPRIVLVVEGEEECALIDMHLNGDDAKSQLSRSKTAVLRAAEVLLDGGHDWALCLIDADFDRLLGKDALWASNVIASEHYDLLVDGIVAAPHNLDGVAISHSRPGEVQAFCLAQSTTLLGWILASSEPVGILRWLVVSGRFDFSVRGWPFRGMSSLTTDSERLGLIASIGHQRSGMSVPESEIEAAIAQHRADPTYSAVNFHSSHDILGVLAELVRAQFGGSASERHVAATLRLAFSCQEFQTLPLMRDAADWARLEHSVKLLNCA